MRSDSETLQESPAVVSSAPHELPLPRFNEEFFNVSTPGSVPLNGSTFANRARIVLQTVDKQHGRFAIDFRRDSGEIALHFNPRFSHRVVVMNTQKNGRWQFDAEERFFSPFEYKKVYTVDFVFSGNSSIIYLNGQFLYQYRQRHIPFEQVSSVRVIGDADIHSVNIA
ncbi:hypothetical protein Y032_0233g3100 [Ancylostoma ceylanicum]|nr:hypothetical protein Y032_0233g3100 [Ancylostoma ceylanicum]